MIGRKDEVHDDLHEPNLVLHPGASRVLDLVNKDYICN